LRTLVQCGEKERREKGGALGFSVRRKSKGTAAAVFPVFNFTL